MTAPDTRELLRRELTLGERVWLNVASLSGARD